MQDQRRRAVTSGLKYVNVRPPRGLCQSSTCGMQQSNSAQQGGPSQNSLQTVTVTADKIPSQLVVLENETIKEGSFSYFYYQLENAEGKALTGSGYGVEEHIEPSSGVHTSEGTFVPATAGVVQDVVGFADWSSGQPTSVTIPTNLLIIDDVFGQTFTVSYGGEEYDLTTVLQHQTSVVNGVVTNSVTDVVP